MKSKLYLIYFKMILKLPASYIMWLKPKHWFVYHDNGFSFYSVGRKGSDKIIEPPTRPA